MTQSDRHYPSFREAVGESAGNLPANAKAAIKAAFFFAVLTPVVAGILSLGLMVVRAAIDWEVFVWELTGGTIDQHLLERYLAKTQSFTAIAVVLGFIVALLGYFGMLPSQKQKNPS